MFSKLRTLALVALTGLVVAGAVSLSDATKLNPFLIGLLAGAVLAAGRKE